VRDVVARRSADDAVEVVRIFARFRETLPAAGAAAVEIRKARAISEMRRDHRFGLHDELVDGAVSEISQPFALLEEGGAATLMPGVGARGRISAAKAGRHAGDRDRAAPIFIPRSQE